LVTDEQRLLFAHVELLVGLARLPSFRANREFRTRVDALCHAAAELARDVTCRTDAPLMSAAYELERTKSGARRVAALKKISAALTHEGNP
jgi:hypothetical protein